jgi:polyisoprenoid-binding protein YceI
MIWLAVFLTLAGSTGRAQAAKPARAIDTEHSTLTVRVYRAGLFGSFGHDHEIQAPIAEGTVETGDKPSVTVRVITREMTVLDPELEPKKRSEIEETMQGDQVLDVSNNPEIRFTSTTVTPIGQDRWLVNGALSLHGQTHGVMVRVRLENGRYLGETTIRQTDYGITPISVARGTVSVKNEVKIEFNIAVK